MLNKAYTKIDKDQREKVIEEFLPVIKHLAYKMSRGFESDNLTDDLISAGIIGLLEVMEKYDAEQGGKAEYLRLLADTGGDDRRAAGRGTGSPGARGPRRRRSRK